MNLHAIRFLAEVDFTAEDTLMGVIDVLGAPHHVAFVHVEHVNGMQVAVRDPHGRYDEIAQIVEGAAQTVEIPGYEGEWVCCVFPFRRG